MILSFVNDLLAYLTMSFEASTTYKSEDFNIQRAYPANTKLSNKNELHVEVTNNGEVQRYKSYQEGVNCCSYTVRLYLMCKATQIKINGQDVLVQPQDLCFQIEPFLKSLMSEKSYREDNENLIESEIRAITYPTPTNGEARYYTQTYTFNMLMKEPYEPVYSTMQTQT